MKNYKLEEITGNLNIEAYSARWGNVDTFGKITELVHGKPTIGNVLVLDFEWSDFLGSFSKFQSKKITEINTNGSKNCIYFKTENNKEYKLTIL